MSEEIQSRTGEEAENWTANALPAGYQLQEFQIKAQKDADGRQVMGKDGRPQPWILGRGTFGITYLAWDGKEKRDVAIKEYYPKDLVERRGTRVTAQGSRQREYYDQGLRSFTKEV
ncbi:MAG: hypothetical protein HQL73_11605, partial [Magnetococcales bacterium]|nr:hypothetical protein [Magnetococcales bacterium]